MKKLLAISLIFMCVIVVSAADAADIGLKGIGGLVGFVMPDYEGNNTLGFGVVADLGTIMPQLRLEGSADYWGNSWDLPGVEWSWSTITIGGTAKYDFPMGESFTPFVGGGLGFAISSWETNYTGETWGWTGTPGNFSDSDTDLGIHVVGGIDMPVGSNMKFTAQAKYAMGGADALWLSGAILVQLD